MNLTVDVLVAAVGRASRRAAEIEQELNAADGRLGDGDTGVTVRRIFERMAGESQAEAAADIGSLFRTLATTASSASGSSLGTLTAVALMSAARQTRGKVEIKPDELGQMLLVARDAVIARGGASLGDKTVADMIDAVALAISGGKDGENLERLALDASAATLERFRQMPCRVGRARMYGDKSIGIDDPGMLAFAHLLDAVVGSD